MLVANRAGSISIFLMQIFLMCTFGQQVMSENEQLMFQLYSSNWLEIIDATKRNDPKSCHKILIIFMETLKEDKQIMIGKVFPLIHETFTSVKTDLTTCCYYKPLIFLFEFIQIKFRSSTCPTNCLQY